MPGEREGTGAHPGGVGDEEEGAETTGVEEDEVADSRRRGRRGRARRRSAW